MQSGDRSKYQREREILLALKQKKNLFITRQIPIKNPVLGTKIEERGKLNNRIKPSKQETKGKDSVSGILNLDRRSVKTPKTFQTSPKNKKKNANDRILQVAYYRRSRRKL